MHLVSVKYRTGSEDRNLSQTLFSVDLKSRLGWCRFIAAAVIYAGFAVYLYQPYFEGFDKLNLRDLFVVNIFFASMGCYALSRRWIGAFTSSLFAGAIYGFGPFVLSLAKFHPTAGTLAAAIPWLFIPAAFGPKFKWQWLRVPLSALSFLMILLFFQLSAHFRLFAVPLQSRLRLSDLAGLLAPLVMVDRSLGVVGFYHVPIAALLTGFLMLIAARRYGVMIILGLGIVLACCNSIFDISPLIWLTIPMLCCSILAGEGLHALAGAGYADRKWLLAISIIMGILSIVTLLLATKYFSVFAGLGAKPAKLFVQSAQMYILGTVVVAVVFFVVRAGWRGWWFRLIILCSAMAADIFLGAKFIVDSIF